MDGRDKTVRVTVFGQEYTIKGGVDADYIREVAALVNARMRETHAAQSSKPPLTIAILTTLNLADELLTCKREKEELIARFEDKAREFADSLNQGLVEEPVPSSR
jgi:cell division protein ZapA